ncbi:hypothetical protein JHK85_000663 [Glycine max]|nr:hypothetical protein JHK85_000663 [Glycine max]
MKAHRFIDMTKRIRKDSSLPEDVEKVNNSSVELDTREGVNDGFPRAGAGANDSLLPGLFYDLALNCLAWASRSDYASLACINKRCGSVGSIVVFAGGTNKYGNVLESAELYDSNSGTWELLPNMHTPRTLCSGFFMDGKCYVIASMYPLIVSLTCGDEYDVKTRNWRKIEEHLTNMVNKYDNERHTWSELGRLPVRADSSNGWGLAFKGCGEKLLVMSGQRGPEGEVVVLN